MKINIPKKVFNDRYVPLLNCDKRYMVLYGGAGSGKSVFAVQRFLIRILTRPLCNILVIRAVAVTNRDSTYALFSQIIYKWGLEALFKFNKTEMQIICTATGNGILFKGLDDVEKLKSITFPKGELTEIWIEEASEVEEGDFNQLDIRLRGRGIKGQIVLSFNPISALHWLKKRFFDRKDPRAVVLKSTYRDNRFLTEEYRQLLEEFKETDPYYYSVYCLGEWGVLGKTIFNSARVAERLSHLNEPEKQGSFVFESYFDPGKNRMMIDDSSISFIPEEGGFIKIYSLPKSGRPYVIGGDTAGEGSDYFAGQVIDNISGSQVCTLRQPFDEDVYAGQIYCLGRYYNNALVAIEANFSSYPIRQLEELGYTNQYVRETEDSFTHKIRQSYGFKTTSVTRPLVIAELVRIVREEPGLINDGDTLGEMLTFVRNERGRAEAQAGAHDDCIMSLAIAYYARSQQSVKRGRVKWTRDMLEDYRRAKPAEREFLLRKFSGR